jgi:hypothetical protein
MPALHTVAFVINGTLILRDYLFNKTPVFDLLNGCVGNNFLCKRPSQKAATSCTELFS